MTQTPTAPRSRARAKSARPPGPGRSHWLLGELEPFAQNPAEYLHSIAQQFGPIALVPLVNRRVLLLSEPELVREVLVSQSAVFKKEYRGREIMGRALGKGLVTSEGSLHKRQRKQLQPAFHHRRIEAYAPAMSLAARNMLEGWKSGESLYINQEMNRLTMAIAVKTLFSVDLNESEYKVGLAIARIQQLAIRELMRVFPPPMWWPNARNRELRSERKQLHQVIQRFVDEQRALGEDRGDLISALVQAADVGDMSRQQMRDELVTLFAAGHETTANAMSWTWALLSQNPAVERELHREIDRVLAGREPCLQDLPNLPYTEAVFKEALRLKPPVWMLNAREAAKNTTLGKYSVAKGTLVFISPYVMHRNKQYFPEPESFRPERWLVPREQKLPRTAFLPFGAGPRVCIGSQFAMQEGVLLIAAIASRFRMRLQQPGEVSALATITYAPAKPMAMLLEARGC